MPFPMTAAWMAQARMVGDKASEITVVRDVLKVTVLEKQKITLVRVSKVSKAAMK